MQKMRFLGLGILMQYSMIIGGIVGISMAFKSDEIKRFYHETVSILHGKAQSMKFQ